MTRQSTTPSRTSKLGSDDPEWTTRCFLIWQHYQNLDEELSWNYHRAARLCAAMSLTPIELGAFLRIQPGRMRLFMKRGHFPPTVELHLTIIERSLFYSSKPPILPTL